MNRANKILLLILLCLSFNQLEAQNDYSFYNYRLLGLKAGWNASSIGLQPAISDLSSDYSYSGGLVYVFSDKKNVGIQIELLFNSRKWIEYFDIYQAKTELQYLELPLMTNINLGNGRFKYLINLGTYFAVKLDQNQYTNLPENNMYYQGFIDRTERGSDFGLLIGGALRYFSNVGVFQIDARFAYGYQKIYNEDATGFRFSNMSVIHVGVAYMIHLKKDYK